MDNHGFQAELPGNPQRGKNIVRAVRMEVRLRFAPQQRQQRLQLDIVVRLVLLRLFFRALHPQQVFPCFVKLLADERRGRHAGNRRFILVVIDRLGVLTQRKLDRERRFEHHIVDAPAGRLEQRDLPADRVGAAWADRDRCHPRLDSFAEATVQWVYPINRAQVRRNGVGILVPVRALKAQPVFIQTEVGMNVDQTGCHHAAAPVNHLTAGGRLVRSHRHNLPVFHPNPSEKTRIRFIHRQKRAVFQKYFFHFRPFPQKSN